MKNNNKMETILNSVIERVTHLKTNTEDVIIKMKVEASLDDAMKTAIRLKLKEHFTKDSVYFLTDSDYLIVDWSLNPPKKLI